jgi:methionyl-tRNA synthetase
VTSSRWYISSTLPYVNARPHLGFALELVQADVLARQHRLAGDQVRFQTGTDDNSLKSVLAASAEGSTVGQFVGRNSRAFAGLRGPLGLSADDFIATSSDPRHRPGVERLWRACARSGDLYTRPYQGRYCVGCEQFYKPAELPGGRCPEHGTVPELVTERNWFFRLSRYASQLEDVISSGRLRIEPAARRNEVLGFIRAGLEDFSASRSTGRARGWGIPVPGDPSQVIYVWWDALSNYITAPGYGTDEAGYQHWWARAGHRVHLAGKGVLRFHAVYWPAILLSAGEPLPTCVLVHDYLTAGGQKISKSGAGASLAADPVALARDYGTDAVRWWLLREVPRTGDADFTVARLVARANEDLANGLGNLVSRVVSLVCRYRDGQVPAAPPARGGPGGQLVPDAALALAAACAQAGPAKAEALAAGDFRAAAGAVWAIVEQANRYAEQARPWELARAQRAGVAGAGQSLDTVLSALVRACRVLGGELAPFVPGLAAAVSAACDDRDGALGPARPLFPRLSEPAGQGGPGAEHYSVVR